MDENIISPGVKPSWIKPLSIFYIVALVPSFLFLLAGFAFGGNDRNFILLISLDLLMCISLLIGIVLGLKEENNLDFSSRSRKLMIAPIYLIIISFLAPMIADILSSIVRSISGIRDTEDVILYILIISCIIHYYFYYKKEA